MNNIEITRPKHDEIESICELLKYVIDDTFTKNGLGNLKDEIADEALQKKEYLIKDFETNGTEHYFFIAKDSGKIVGTIESSPTDKFISKCTNGELESCAKIGTIYVHPNYQRKGIGQRLLYKMRTKLKKDGAEEFCLDSGFKTAQKIWIKQFGKPEYHLKDFWGEGGDHMIWKVKITDSLK